MSTASHTISHATERSFQAPFFFTYLSCLRVRFDMTLGSLEHVIAAAFGGVFFPHQHGRLHISFLLLVFHKPKPQNLMQCFVFVWIPTLFLSIRRGGKADEGFLFHASVTALISCLLPLFFLLSHLYLRRPLCVRCMLSQIIVTSFALVFFPFPLSRVLDIVSMPVLVFLFALWRKNDEVLRV